MPAQNLTNEIKNRSAWSIVMGLLTAALGVFLIVYPLATATITTVLLGWALIFVGISQFVFALHSQTVGKFFLRAFLSVLYGFCGIALAFSPIAGVVALTALLGALLLIHAGVATATAFQMRPVEGWGWFLFDAVASHPFKFFLVHEAQPNAFATPGGNIYVVDSLLSFVKNQEQLAGTLCHEVSHTIHHDSVTLMEKEERIKEREIGAAVLLGPTPTSWRSFYSASCIRSATVTRGSDRFRYLRRSRIQPWELVWLFQDFKDANPNELPQLFSDHPDDEHRISAVEQHFRQNPATFGTFNSDAKSAKAFLFNKNAPEVFLH